MQEFLDHSVEEQHTFPRERALVLLSYVALRDREEHTAYEDPKEKIEGA